MKRPQHMSMKELISLPVLAREHAEPSVPCYAANDVVYGGAFEDDRGYAWGTVLETTGWARYPLRRPSRSVNVRSPIQAFLASSRLAGLRSNA